MRELIGILAGFLCLPFLMKVKKLGLGGALVIVGLVIALVAGMPLAAVGDAAWGVATSATAWNTILSVLMIGVLGMVMNHYGILKNIVANLQKVIRNPKIILMLLPPLMGLLPVPGGAFLSAPFVDSVATPLGIPPGRRSAINLSFRHVTMFVLPFTSLMLLIQSSVPDVSIYQLICLNFPYAICFGGMAYWCYLRGVRYERAPKEQGIGRCLWQIVLLTSPIWVIVLFNAALGVPVWLCVFISLVVLLFLCDRKDFAKTALSGVNFTTLFMLIGVYFVQHIIRGQSQVMQMFANLFSNASGISILLVIALATMALGVSTGMNLVSMGILVPLINDLPIDPQHKLLYLFFAFCFAFIGYYFSPLHLCQILSDRSIGCKMAHTSKENLRMLPVLLVMPWLLYGLYSLVLL